MSSVSDKTWVLKIHEQSNEVMTIIINLPTTSKNPVLLDIGSVLTWHMYHPRSVSRVSLMWRDHVRWPLCVTAIRWFLVITWLAIVKMVCVSTRSHATCKSPRQILLFIYLYTYIWDGDKTFCRIKCSHIFILSEQFTPPETETESIIFFFYLKSF